MPIEPVSTPASKFRILKIIICITCGSFAVFGIIGGGFGILVGSMLMYQDTIQKTAVPSDFYIRDVFQTSMQNGRRIRSRDDYIWVNGISIQPSGNISCVNIPYKICESEDDCIKTQAQLLSLNPPIIPGFIAPAIYPTGRPFCTRIYFNIEYLFIDDGFLAPGIAIGYLFIWLFIFLCFAIRYGNFGVRRSHNVSPTSEDRTSPELLLPSTTVVAPPKSGETSSIV